MCPNRDWFSNFEKLDGCFAVMSDDHLCNVEGMGTFRINMDDGIVQELKEVRYIPQLKRNLITQKGSLKGRILPIQTKLTNPKTNLNHLKDNPTAVVLPSHLLT